MDNNFGGHFISAELASWLWVTVAIVFGGHGRGVMSNMRRSGDFCCGTELIAKQQRMIHYSNSNGRYGVVIELCLTE